jgi:hypothetical protein
MLAFLLACDAVEVQLFAASEAVHSSSSSSEKPLLRRVARTGLTWPLSKHQLLSLLGGYMQR